MRRTATNRHIVYITLLTCFIVSDLPGRSDGSWTGWSSTKAAELAKMIWSLQPNIIINNRLYPGSNVGKFEVLGVPA